VENLFLEFTAREFKKDKIYDYDHKVSGKNGECTKKITSKPQEKKI